MDVCFCILNFPHNSLFYSPQTVFSDQLRKHDQTVDLINKNLGAQDNILRALTDANAQFAIIRQAFTEAKAK